MILVKILGNFISSKNITLNANKIKKPAKAINKFSELIHKNELTPIIVPIKQNGNDSKNILLLNDL